MRLSGGEPHLIMLATRKGVIKYASPELALQLSAKGAGGGLGAGFGAARLGGSANGGTDGAEGGGGGGEGAMLPAGMAAAQLLSGFALTDFLPPFWKDTHTRLLKVRTASYSMREQTAVVTRGLQLCCPDLLLGTLKIWGIGGKLTGMHAGPLCPLRLYQQSLVDLPLPVTRATWRRTAGDDGPHPRQSRRVDVPQGGARPHPGAAHGTWQAAARTRFRHHHRDVRRGGAHDALRQVG